MCLEITGEAFSEARRTRGGAGRAMPPFSPRPTLPPSRRSCSHGCGFSGFQKSKGLANFAKAVVRMQEGEGEKMFAAQRSSAVYNHQMCVVKSCCETVKLQVGLFQHQGCQGKKRLKKCFSSIKNQHPLIASTMCLH